MSAPVASLAELAVQLKMTAWREACGVEALEEMAARAPDERVFAVSLREARLCADLIGQAYELMKALIPHEQAVHKLIAAERPK